MTYPDPAGKDFSYLTGLKWRTTDRWLIEREMIQHGGKVRVKGKDYGEGIAHHYKAAITALFPSWKWNKWAHLLISGFAEHSEVAVMGPASSGKTFCASAFGLTTFLLWASIATPESIECARQYTPNAGITVAVTEIHGAE